MAKKKQSEADRGKKRTRAHVLADLSLVHVQYFIVNAGFTSEATTKDYGYDLTVNTFDPRGIIEPGSLLVQLKASETLPRHADGIHVVFDLEVKDYNLWKDEPNPVFLVLFDARSRRAYWLYFQRYIRNDSNRKPKAGAESVRVKVPLANRVRTDFFRHARRIKLDVMSKILGADPHG